MRYLALMTLIGTLAAGGCGSGESGAEEFGLLTRQLETTSAELRDELVRIQRDRGTPELLNESDVQPEDNAAVQLLALYANHKVSAIRERAEVAFPAGQFVFNPVQLRRVAAFRKRYEEQFKEARAALERPQCDFGIQFMAGCTAELKFVDVVHVCANMEAFRAAEALFGEEPQPDDAVEALWHMLRLAACMAAEKHPVARLEGAYVRTKAFVVLQAIVKHESIEREHLELLEQLVRTELDSWPPDADAWIGERALGLHAYEMVHHDLARELMTEEDVTRFREEGILDDFPEAARQNVDRDELYYVRAMRKIIEGCDRPYYLREEIFEEINADLQERRNASDFPLVAARLLLPDIHEAHATIAQDRANWEAWALALAAATGRPTPDYEINPLTGRRYAVQEYRPERGRAEVAVRGFSLDEPGDPHTWIVVPFDMETEEASAP